VVVIVNPGDTVSPAATVTEAGTLTPGSLLDSATTAPPDGAFPFNVTELLVLEAPPTSDAGARFNTDTVGAKTVSVALFVTPPALAVIVTGKFAATGAVLIINVGDAIAPAVTVTEAGSVTLGSLLLNVTTIPPPGAGPVSVTVFEPVIPEPPTTDAGTSDTADIETVEGGVTVSVAVLVTPL